MSPVVPAHRFDRVNAGGVLQVSIAGALKRVADRLSNPSGFDTADASMVGPDVDTAGLYGGLTRGRVHNVALVVARTDSAARECLAESMQRGTPELTMQDAVRAAQAEMRRAAWNREAAMATGPVGGAPSAWRGM